MSIGWICTDNYTDGIHLVKRNSDNKELYVFASHESYSESSELVVKDFHYLETLNVEDFTHLQWYEYGSYYQCDDHPEHWIFDGGDDLYEECPKCKEVQEEILSYKVAEDVYQYKTNREFNRLKDLLEADKYRFWSGSEEDIAKPQQGLFILITEYDSDGDDYFYYKTIEKSFVDGLEWSGE